MAGKLRLVDPADPNIQEPLRLPPAEGAERGRRLGTPTAPTAIQTTPDHLVEFVLQHSIQLHERDGCTCYMRAKMEGRRHNKRTCQCRCGHKAKGRK